MVSQYGVSVICRLLRLLLGGLGGGEGSGIGWISFIGSLVIANGVDSISGDALGKAEAGVSIVVSVLGGQIEARSEGANSGKGKPSSVFVSTVDKSRKVGGGLVALSTGSSSSISL